MYILYWGEVSKQVEVIKDTCWIECLEETMSKAHVGFVSERISLFAFERDSGYEVSYME